MSPRPPVRTDLIEINDRSGSHPLHDLDLRAIAGAAWLPALSWPLLVVAVAATGTPGVICITPLAWLLALPVGRSCESFTRSRDARAVMMEAGIAGASLGLTQGSFAAVFISMILGDATPAFIVATIVLSLAACTSLSIVTASIQFTRHVRESRTPPPADD